MTQQLTFGTPPAQPQPRYPRRLTDMHAVYGRTPGHTCGQCTHLVGRRYSRVYYKCAYGPQSASPATDWRKSWPACGRFEEEAQ
ncbi:MAG: hypothetical protein KKA73_00690 [Chloroflexi bacterium]|nr:hypothetical protein [Chloroflexota bacterium]MBU1746179.1 hypothetical protein [Chloroflexota bacterium]